MPTRSRSYARSSVTTSLDTPALERTLIRVGNAEYAKTNRSYGLTTLRNQHVTVNGSMVRFTFRGKHGIQYTGRDDIERVIEPVMLAPLRRRWEAVRAEIDALVADPIVRVPWTDQVYLKRILEAGATSVMIPMVEDEAEAKAVPSESMAEIPPPVIIASARSRLSTCTYAR